MANNSGQQHQWSPPAGGIAGCALLGAALAVTGVTLATDPPGRALVVAAGVGLLVFAAMSWRCRPKLAVTAQGLAVRGWWRSRLLSQASLSRLRVTEFRRLGRTQRMLEIETHDDELVLFTRWDLGTDPRNVLAALTAAGYRC